VRTLVSAAVLALLAGISSAAPEGIPIQYMDSHGRRPAPATLTPVFTEGPRYEREVAIEAAPGARANLLVLIVDSGVYSDIAPALGTYVSDLSVDGFAAEVWQVTGGSPAEIRADLQAEFAGGNLFGAVLVGNISTGWMDGSDGEYPMDLYLMDMNGTWTDSDADGLFENATGWAPEIFVGRLTPTWLTLGNSAELLNNYFAKNHAYRTGALTLPDRALAYEEAFTGLTGYVSLVYSDVTTKSDPSGTTADDFRTELLNGYEWVHLIAHSSPWGSSFHVGAPPSGAGTINNYEVVPLDPEAFFYVLNCCTNGRWTEIDNMANMYIWADTYGLVAIAQAKTDYTNEFQELYTELATGDCIGEAFRVWLGANLSLEHAAVLLGDPTLRPHGNGLTASIPRHEGPGILETNWPASLLTSGLHSEGDIDACIDPSGGEVFSVFGTSDPVRANILATHSTGDTWISPMQVCEHEYWDWHPSVGTDGQGIVWTAWHSMNENIYGYDIYVSSWTGSGWASATQLTDTDAFEAEPSIAGGNGKGWVVWQQWLGGESDIDGRMWTGSAWTTMSAISGLEGDERVPDLAWSDGKYGLVYQAERGGDLAICFRDAPDSGPFTAEATLSSSSAGGACREPAIAADGSGGFWVVWEQDGCIRVRHGAPGAWGPEETVSATGTASRPAISCLGGETTAVAWIENGTDVIFALHSSGGWGSAIPGALCPAVESVALAYRSPTSLVALYGARDSSLHWDIWAASCDPAGIGGSGGGGIFHAIRPLASPCGVPVVLDLTSESSATIRIWDLAGREMQAFPAEPGQVSWDGCDSSGRPAPSGLYFVTAECGTAASSCSVVLLR
jgi:hypothetical protein